MTGLNEEQKQAAGTLKGPLMVLSCAGSGKTSVILERCANLIRSGTAPERILAVTFSRNGASEMQDRFERDYGLGRVEFRTIHSLCYRILAERYGQDRLVFFSGSDRKEFLAQVKADFPDYYQSALSAQDPQAFSELMTQMGHDAVCDYYGEPCDRDDDVYRIYKAYAAAKKAKKKIDYDDLIFMAHRTLVRNPSELEKWRSRFDYTMIDEFQDTSRLQGDIFFLLAQKNRNICVVGDDDQSIYSFRDADPEIFRRFMEAFPETKKVTLCVNYRSLPGIVERSANLIARNHLRYPKTFRAARSGEAQITIKSFRDFREQAGRLWQMLKADFAAGLRPDEIAVLYRKRRAVLNCVLPLMEHDVPFVLSEPLPDIAKGQVLRDVLCYRRLSETFDGNRVDAKDLKVILNRPVRYLSPKVLGNGMLFRGQVYKALFANAGGGYQKKNVADSLDRLFYDLQAMKNMNAKELVNYLDTSMHYYSYLADQARFLHLDPDYFQQEFDVLRRLALRFDDMEELASSLENLGEELKAYSSKTENGVFLSTFHGAKGLQWKKVYILSADYVDTSDMTPQIREEERRLFYVAMTRAEDALTICHTGVPSDYISESVKMPAKAAVKRKVR